MTVMDGSCKCFQPLIVLATTTGRHKALATTVRWCYPSYVGVVRKEQRGEKKEEEKGIARRAKDRLHRRMYAWSIQREREKQMLINGTNSVHWVAYSHRLHLAQPR
jgi:hypothetical protein